MSRRTILCNALEPLGRQELRVLEKLASRPGGEPAARLYRFYRNQPDGAPVPKEASKKATGLGRPNVERAQEWLERLGLLSIKHISPGRVEMTLNAVPPSLARLKHGRVDFRHAPVLTVFAPSSTVLSLEDYQWLHGHTAYESPIVPRTYEALRYTISQNNPAQITCTDLAIVADASETEQMAAALETLAHKGLIAFVGDGSLVAVAPPYRPAFEDPVSDQVLRRWMEAVCIRVNPLDPTMLVKSSRPRDQVQVLMQFVDEVRDALMQYRKEEAIRQGRPNAVIPIQRPGANRTRERNVARQLLKDYSFEHLQPYLLYFLCEWDDGSTQDYGKTLLTFSKQLHRVSQDAHDEGFFNANAWKRRLQRLNLEQRWDLDKEDVTQRDS